ncbi:sensor histidine kinase [Planomonospora alba]
MRLDDLLAELQEHLETVLAARDRIHALLEAVVSIGSDLDLETVLRRITEAATALVDARYGALGVIGEGGTLERFIPVGLTEEEIAKIEHWPHGKGLLGLLIEDPRPLRLADLADHPASYGFPEGHPPMHSFLGVPVRVREEVFGNLYLTGKRGGGEFDEEEETMVGALATAAVVAIENARLYEQTRRREAELEAFADIVAHDLKSPLSAVRGFTELAHEQLSGQPGHDRQVGRLERALAATDRMKHLIDDLLAYSTARDAVLRPVEVDLGALVRGIADEHVTAASAGPDTPVPQVSVGPLPAVRADPVLVHRLFANLIGNAVTYTRPGQAAQITVTLPAARPRAPA